MEKLDYKNLLYDEMINGFKKTKKDDETKKISKEIALHFLNIFEDYFSKIEDNLNQKFIVKSKISDFYILTLCVEYLAKSFFALIYDSENLNSENFRKKYFKEIKTHKTYEFFIKIMKRFNSAELKKFGLSDEGAKFYDSFKFKSKNDISNSIQKSVFEVIGDYEEYKKIKNTLETVRKINMSEFEHLSSDKFIEDNDRGEINNIYDKMKEKELYLEEDINLASLILDNLKEDPNVLNKIKLFKEKIIGGLFIALSLMHLSFLFNQLHNELRYFDELEKEKFETSYLYKDLNYFIELLGEIYSDLKKFIHSDELTFDL